MKAKLVGKTQSPSYFLFFIKFIVVDSGCLWKLGITESRRFCPQFDSVVWPHWKTVDDYEGDRAGSEGLRPVFGGVNPGDNSAVLRVAHSMQKSGGEISRWVQEGLERVDGWG